ncbi:flocculation protein FLO11-like [Haliotis rufescens]|uniref:flocculation protein FLO11-like n=1 Tax=Haliotis rufescens TaxID=6454 RepID=UPI00201FB0F5|nr:flocculation protein FLO11-like [Haliotis rufescens]
MKRLCEIKQYHYSAVGWVLRNIGSGFSREVPSDSRSSGCDFHHCHSQVTLDEDVVRGCSDRSLLELDERDAINCQLKKNAVMSSCFLGERSKLSLKTYCQDVKHACAHRPCRNYEVCIPVLAAVRHICLPTADLPGAQNAIAATDTAGKVDGTVTVMTPHSATSTSVIQVMTTRITSIVATSFAVTSATTAESSAVTSETTAESSPPTSETTAESSAVTSATTSESSPPTSATTAESSPPTSSTTAESSAVTSATTAESSAVTSATTAESSPPTSATTTESSSPTSATTAESSPPTSATTAESSSPTSATTAESSSPTSATTAESSSPTSATTAESSAVTSATTAASSAVTSATTAESSAVTSATTEESSAVTSEITEESSAVTSEITDKSSALTGASNPPSEATISQQLYNYTYLGCYNDSTARALNETLLTSSTMSHATCFRFCHPYKYAGLEYSDECFCDDVIAPHHTLQDERNCTSVCPGNSDELCGGYWYIAIYELVQT